ncbi:ribosomal protein L37AE/L43A [Caldicoprobacter guelmensis]|uniref:TFIIB-type zinc finger domain-containing protein n=1 Tax=Caldicoprobacter guelmensis TaxID=1170224 RepID=UPI00195C16D6|nr:TFIIB-type zinc finger domain-containing protein [Caldicoprobacter guelmensis]MBM7582980.1 ribosomal protein L37AE/L43A [Caldicoprobacter guelmensis]
MYRKICPYCNNASYSSYREGLWICPHCHMDITEIVGADENVCDEHKGERGELDAFIDRKGRCF